jgi:hypothetical protein
MHVIACACTTIVQVEGRIGVRFQLSLASCSLINAGLAETVNPSQLATTGQQR